MPPSSFIRFFILFVVCIAFEARAATIPDIVSKAKPAVVQVIATDSSWNQIKTGTGFFVSADGQLLTNFHVIQGAIHITACTNKGAVFAFERLISGSADTDVALLKFQASDVDFLKIGTSTTAVEGEAVLVIGNPEGLRGTVSNGIISAFRENRFYIQITAPISPGSSGSPVLDETGQVIGMATLVYKEGQNLNFAISADAIGTVLRSGLVQAITAPSAAPDSNLAWSFDTPPPSSGSDSQESVLEFVKQFWDHNANNDPTAWASDFSNNPNYCYYSGTGFADRRFVRNDRAKLVEKYPNRHYRFFGPWIEMGPGDNIAHIRYAFSYSYSGMKSAAGSCDVSLTVERFSGKWCITQYDEKVNRE